MWLQFIGDLRIFLFGRWATDSIEQIVHKLKPFEQHIMVLVASVASEIWYQRRHVCPSLRENEEPYSISPWLMFFGDSKGLQSCFVGYKNRSTCCPRAKSSESVSLWRLS